MTLDDIERLSKILTTRSIARPVCHSWAYCSYIEIMQLDLSVLKTPAACFCSLFLGRLVEVRNWLEHITFCARGWRKRSKVIVTYNVWLLMCDCSRQSCYSDRSRDTSRHLPKTDRDKSSIVVSVRTTAENTALNDHSSVAILTSFGLMQHRPLT